ncbi:DNA ligase 3-like [Limulus polyphemus]|uniref:DNA ligase n=1 Tax=Limulus polyphemus TaxID=6850 RepID=A0ABM1B8D2_LIMPO|nr:DNA ligase 3-like [Limulus polyphemus]
MTENRYCVDYAKRGTASCRKCKQKIEKDVLRIGKIVPNPFTDGEGEMKQWFHVPCIFEQLQRARATTKKIEDPGDLEGWIFLKNEDKEVILNLIKIALQKSPQKIIKKDTVQKNKKEQSKTRNEEFISPSSSKVNSFERQSSTKDDSFREFCQLCAKLAEEPSYNEKTKIMANFFENGRSGNGFSGDLLLWVRMLLPGVVKRVYNLQSKQLVKLFSQIFGTSQEEMIIDLEEGDVAETIKIFFEQSEMQHNIKSYLTLQEVDTFLDNLSLETREENQSHILKKIAIRCTGNDLKMIIRLIKRDLRINTGAKHVLDALHPTAYEAFQASRNLQDVVEKVNERKRTGNLKKSLSIQVSLMTPVLPMLAEPCSSVEYAFKKFPSGMYAEIKYDGERVQVHKHGDKFNYFSRSLKPVMPHKISHLKEYIPKAFPQASDLILDSEVLLVDTQTGKPLPFGTLGVHKKAAFKDASVCLFVFDCIHYNGENLMERPLSERRNILSQNMMEIKNHIMFSEMKLVIEKEVLKKMIQSAINQGLEGLVLKGTNNTYEPGKRHWLKIKKDYLEDGAMADSADLVVLGAYFGTGNKGGMMSIFLMGCYDPASKKWCTVTKVHGGHDDATFEKLQTELDMKKIRKDPSKVPAWLKVNKTLIPDFVANDPKNSPVWEIVGAEFTKAEIHTANGISIRFPRVAKIRDDKTWKEATNLQELQELFKKSKQVTGEIQDMFKSKNSYQDISDEAKPKLFKKISKSGTPKKRKQEKRDETSAKTLKCSFPDIFSGIKLYLPETVEQYDYLCRLFIAYDGYLVEHYNIEEATHIVNDNEVTLPDTRALIVNVNWLWDSIKLQRQAPTKAYVVKKNGDKH